MVSLRFALPGLAAALTMACAHRPSLQQRLAEEEVVVVADTCGRGARLRSWAIEEEAAGGLSFLGGSGSGLGAGVVATPYLFVLVAPIAILAHTEQERQEEAARAAWRALPGNDGLTPAEENALVAELSSLRACEAMNRAFLEGAQAVLRPRGWRVVPEGPGTATTAPRLRLAAHDVLLTYAPGDPHVRLALELDGALHRGGTRRRLFLEPWVLGPPVRAVDPARFENGREPLSGVQAIADPTPLLVRALLADRAADGIARAAALARAGGGWAADVLVDSLADVRRSGPARDPAVCGLGPVLPEDGAPVEAAEYPWGRERFEGTLRALPVPLDPRTPELAWEAWRPRSGELPAGTVVRYDLRVWRSPRASPAAPPLVARTGLEVPRASLAGVIEPDVTYDWSVRAAVSIPGHPPQSTGWSFVYPRPWEREGTPELAGACALAPATSPPLQLRAWTSGAPAPHRTAP